MNTFRTATIAALWALAACSPGGQEKAATATVTPAQARAELLQADYAFASLALDAGIETAYEAYLADDAVQLPDGGLPLAGKSAIMANVIASAAESRFALSWEPVTADVSDSGDLGYTWGNYFLETVEPDGTIFTAEGKYANVWRRDADGWRVVLDVSNQNEPPFLDELDFGALLDDEGSDESEALPPASQPAEQP